MQATNKPPLLLQRADSVDAAIMAVITTSS